MHFTGADREKAAVHEAGHALVAAARRVRIVAVGLNDSGEGGVQLGDESVSDLDQAWIAHGGPQAEVVIYGEFEIRWTPPGEDDISKAYEASQRAGVHNLEVMHQVKEFLAEHRVGLELVATRLMECEKWQGGELVQLLHEALDG